MERSSKGNTGRPKKHLSASAKKRSKAEANRKYRESHQESEPRKLHLGPSMFKRWTSKAKELGVSNVKLAEILLDGLDQTSRPSTTSPSPNQPSTSTGIVSGSTPFPPFVPMSTSTPMEEGLQAAKVNPVHPGGESSSSLFSSISGIEKLPSPSTSPRVIAAEDSSDDAVNISVNYKVDGEFVYPQELETDVTLEDDDFWEPVLSCQKGRNCDGLTVISPNEEVHGQDQFGLDGGIHVPAESGASFSKTGLHRILSDPTGSESTPLYIITETRLKDLAHEARSNCDRCSQPLDVSIAASGSSAHITWTCKEGHQTYFCGQETLQRSHLGDLKLAAAIVLSGNNFTKVHLMAKFSNLAFLHGSTFNHLQQKYVFPVVEEEAAEMFEANKEKHRGKQLVVLGDGRNDSPGHCAQYLTYTFMENDSKDILHVEIRDKRQTALISSRMEVDALLKGLVHLKDEDGLELVEMVTDAHTTITSRMRQEHPDMKHSYDVWHGAKNLGKKLSKVSASAANRPLAYWQSHITNHFWHCSKTCGGSPEVFKHKWRGVLHHTTGVHEWALGGGVGPSRCEHDILPEREEYLKPGSPPHLALASLAMDERFLKNIPFFVNFRHTGELESLHNHILMYASKRFAFGFTSYRARNLLAMIDYQRHKNRPTRKTSEGEDKYVAKWSKSCKEYIAIKEKMPKEYSYIPGMMQKILKLRWEEMHRLQQPHVQRPDDPRNIAPRLATKSPPKIEELLKRRHVSRF